MEFVDGGIRRVDEMFMTRSLNVTPKTTEQHLIARSDKSVAYVITTTRCWHATISCQPNGRRGGAPIGAGGVMTPPLFEAKGAGGDMI